MFLPEAEMVDRRVYRLRSRNLLVGVWDAPARGFIGIRRKFDSEYLFTEYHHDADPHVGTAVATADLGIDVPDDIEVIEGRSDGKYFRTNRPLFDLLKPHDEQVQAELTAERAECDQESESRRWRPQTEREHFLEQALTPRRARMDEMRKNEAPWKEIVDFMQADIRETHAEATRLFGPNPDRENP